MTARSGHVLVMAGGTGGHIFPGLAVASALQNQGVEVRWLGAAGGMECERVPAAGIDLDVVRITGLRGKGLVGWLLLPLRLLRAVSQAAGILRRQRPACVISFGGYVAGPGGIAAWLKRIPLLVHEQNRIPGMTNRALARISRQVLQAFDQTFPPALGALTTGNPVRSSVVAVAAPAERWADRSGPVRLLVTGGSQGAAALNALVPGALAALGLGVHIAVRHQTGKRDCQATAARYSQAGIQAEVTPFIDDMAAAYAWADLVICRSGALTVSELAAAGLGAILVPFPHAVDDHQTRNAMVLADVGAALVLAEGSLDQQKLASVLTPLLADRARLLDMALAARRLAIPDAAEQVAAHCLEWVPA